MFYYLLLFSSAIRITRSVLARSALRNTSTLGEMTSFSLLLRRQYGRCRQAAHSAARRAIPNTNRNQAARTSKKTYKLQASRRRPSFVFQAAYIRVPPAARTACTDAGLSFREGVHAAGHAILNVVPLLLMCGPGDLATECDNPYETRCEGYYNFVRWLRFANRH